MALDAKDLLAVQDQLSLIRGAMRVVASDASQQLAIPGIPYLLTHRMGKFTL
jgi:hypothetical protein